jgi:hypothetical protein
MPALKRKSVSFRHSGSELDESHCPDSWIDVPGSDPEVDITMALAGKGYNSTTSSLLKRQKTEKDEKIDEEGLGDDDEELQVMIQQSITKRNIKSGTEILKKSKGKARIVKGEVGGGSFQSMGMSSAAVALESTRTYLSVRLASISSACAYTPRFPDTYTYSASCHTGFARLTPSRSCRHGSHRVRKVVSIYDTPDSALGRSTFDCVRRTRTDFDTDARACLTNTQSWKVAGSRLAWRLRTCR